MSCICHQPYGNSVDRNVGNLADNRFDMGCDSNFCLDPL